MFAKNVISKETQMILKRQFGVFDRILFFILNIKIHHNIVEIQAQIL